MPDDLPQQRQESASQNQGVHLANLQRVKAFLGNPQRLRFFQPASRRSGWSATGRPGRAPGRRARGFSSAPDNSRSPQLPATPPPRWPPAGSTQAPAGQPAPIGAEWEPGCDCAARRAGSWRWCWRRPQWRGRPGPAGSPGPRRQTGLPFNSVAIGAARGVPPKKEGHPGKSCRQRPHEAQPTDARIQNSDHTAPAACGGLPPRAAAWYGFAISIPTFPPPQGGCHARSCGKFRDEPENFCAGLTG